MALFQSTVIEKYINAQDQKVLKEKWEAYKVHFHDPNIQENIRNAKEEQYQEGFLRDLFVNILGYTLNPANDYNLTTELKNVKDSKKADGGIVVKDKVVGVIELKGTNTTDLSKVETQAFGYKHNQSGCTYVITSNFEKLRFYIDNAIEHQAFNLFELSETEFSLFYLCLAYDNISRDLPKKIKNDSHNQEEITTKQLYKDYSLFKRELFNNLVELNPNFEPLLLFKKSQKLLDRFLFLFFAEDRHLLPPNSVRMILKQWKQLQEMDAYAPLYKRFKKYFGYLNTGHKGKKYDVYPYNGGLFKPDEVLDLVKIDDELLYKYTLKLSEYDFASEVDVNILGHIFENSLNEIEEIQTQLEENPTEVKLSKRKKDGVFYTPKYITKYIVENTIGKLCEEKKTEANLVEEDYNINRQAKTKKDLLKKLNTYREWLLQLTVVDPACGSGAFLNEALNYLIAEHQYLDELETKLMGGGFVFPNVENSILENNLFGVDINNESVEIAKLSLWLRTAQPNRKLNDLSNNIKCGNSLIDDPELAGDKAFNWEKEFPQIFEKGGFDVVIGNPPYVGKTFTKEEKIFYNESYETAQYQLDLYVTFMEVGTMILKNSGKISYIVPNSWLKNLMFSNCRLFVLNKLYFDVIIPNLDNVFSDASVDTLIFVASKSKKNNSEIEIGQFVSADFSKKHTVDQNRFFDNEKLIFDVEISKKLESIFNKIDKKCARLSQISDVTRGINPYDKYRGQSAEVIKNKLYHSTDKKDETFVPEIRGKHVNRYSLEWDGKSYVSYGDWLAAPREPKFFKGNRIVCRQVLGVKLNCTFIDSKFIIDQSVFISKFDEDQSKKYSPKFILAQLTSRLVSYYFRYKANEFDSLFPKIKIGEFKKLPVMLTNEEKQKPFIEKADKMLTLNKNQQKVSSQFQRSLQRQFQKELEKLPGKLQDWYELSYAEFIKELKKKKIKLSLSQEAEWEDYFLSEQEKAVLLKIQIDTTDKEIDQMVYELYGLTKEEIEIVENS